MGRTSTDAATRAHQRTLNPSVDRAIDELKTAIRRGAYDDAPPAVLAKRVAETLIATVATAASSATLEDIVQKVRAVGAELALVRREHLLVGNVTRRVLRVIRDEGTTSERGGANANAGGGADGSQSKKLKQDVIDTAHEVMEEMMTVSTNIASQSGDFVTRGCVVMTMGTNAGAGTGLSEAFLRDANKRRDGDFSVVVAECAPRYDGHAMAKTLAEKGIKDVSLISDSAVYATMPNVKLVVLSARGVLCDGSAFVDSGAYNIALAAKAHSVPVIVLVGSYSISPKNPETGGYGSMHRLASPAAALSYADAGAPEAVVVNPAFEYIPPHMIDVFVTDHGSHCPGFIKLLLQEMYSPHDYQLASK